MTTPYVFDVPPPLPRKASGIVVALGIFNIVYGSLFRLCCGLGAFLASLSASAFTDFLESLARMQGREMPPLEMMLSGPVRSYSMIKGFVLLILGVSLCFGGVGLLRLKAWGRNLSIGVAVAEIAWVLIDFGISIFFLYPLLAKMGGGFPQASQMVLNVVFGTLSALVKLAYPVALLICLNIESVRRQFEPLP
ncbi:hypothetical protein HZA56_10720 [Candidatus Poribacteria bacterium]|nr:hypothetical protein [Candidatus Poribacteria bacterium]